MSSDRSLTPTRRDIVVSDLATGPFAGTGTAFTLDAGGLAARSARRDRVHDWRDHFDTIRNGAILSDTNSRMQQYRSEDESVTRTCLSSGPLSDDLTRLGFTEVIRKVEGPSWAPFPSMKERNPDRRTSSRLGRTIRSDPRALPQLAGLPHPRRAEYAQDRPQMVGRLHRALQRADR